MKNVFQWAGLIVLCISVASSPAFAKQDKHDKAKSLPPGLQKKLERTGELPPGWQKKLVKGDVLDMNVYKHGKVVVPVDEDGVVSIQVEDRVIRVMETTREILDILQY